METLEPLPRSILEPFGSSGAASRAEMYGGSNPATLTNEYAHYYHVSNPVTAAPDRWTSRQGVPGESGTKPKETGGRAGIRFILTCAQVGINLVENDDAERAGGSLHNR